MRKQRRMPAEVYEFIVDQLNFAGTPPPGYAAKVQKMADEHFAGTALEGEVPTLPTIRDIIEEERTHDDTTAWTMLGADLDEARFLPQVVAALVERSGGAVTRISRREAQWTMRMRAAAPFPPIVAWLLAREYIRCEPAGGDAAAHLDLSVSIAAGLLAGGSDDLIAQHVRQHADRWLGRKLCAWAITPERVDRYVAEAGKVGDIALASWVRTEDSYIEFRWITKED